MDLRQHLHARLHRIWIAVLKDKDIPAGQRVETLLRRTLVDTAEFHLYRGETLVARAAELHKDWGRWVASHEIPPQSRHPTEDESLDWLAAEMERAVRALEER